MRSIVNNWLQRHRHPGSLGLHAIGIPVLAAGLLLGAWQLYHGLWSLWWRPVGLIILGYIPQWIGHRIEGNDMGEVVLIKRILKKPYIAIAPPRETPAPAPVDRR